MTTTVPVPSASAQSPVAGHLTQSLAYRVSVPVLLPTDTHTPQALLDDFWGTGGDSTFEHLYKWTLAQLDGEPDWNDEVRSWYDHRHWYDCCFCR